MSDLAASSRNKLQIQVNQLRYSAAYPHFGSFLIWRKCETKEQELEV